MIITNYNNNIYLSWRDSEGNKVIKNDTYKPYFYVKETAREPATYKATKTIVRDFEYERGEWVNLDGDKLKKVYVDMPKDIYKAKEEFSQTYEADVPFHHRYAIDQLESIPEYNMRKWYWDMEWQQGGEHDSKITAIVAYDNFDNQFYTWTWQPTPNEDIEAPSVEGYNCLMFNEHSEEEMIRQFLICMEHCDPDMLIAWFGLKFDLPKLLERCCALSINPLGISPLGVIDGLSFKNDEWVFTKGEGYNPTAQPIKGRITLNLDLAFERQWNDAQRGTLPSLALDFVSKTLFGEGKHTETKFTDPNEFYRRGWLEDSSAYLQYAIIDVELLRKIDEENFTSEAILSLQRLLVAPFDACFFASNMGSMYFMRNAWWKAPTGSKPKHKVCDSCGYKNPNDKKLKTCKKCKESLSYSGAMVYNPKDENTNGLHYNVAAFDFAGLYPSMIIARNISFETKSSEETVFGADLNTPQNLKEVDGEYERQMLYYTTEELGLLPKSLLALKDLRNEYKTNMKEARNSGDKEQTAKWNNNQMAVKRLMASFYGILAYKGFGWADVNLAASITASAREAIRLAAFKAKEMKA